jgi:hypothetical protein
MNQRPPRDLSEVLVIAAAIVFSTAGLLYLAGAVTYFLHTGQWVRSPWIDGIRVIFHPGNPSVAFGATASEVGVVAYWTVLAVLVCCPFAATLCFGYLWQRHRSVAGSRARALAKPSPRSRPRSGDGMWYAAAAAPGHRPRHGHRPRSGHCSDTLVVVSVGRLSKTPASTSGRRGRAKASTRS